MTANATRHGASQLLNQTGTRHSTSIEIQSESLLLLNNLQVSDPFDLIDVTDVEAHKDLNSKMLRPLFDSSKRLVGQLQRLMGFDIQIEPTDAQNYTRLAQKINFAFENQRAINTINARLFAISYMSNIFNFAKTRNLQKSLSRGKAQIVELQTAVTTMEDTVSALNIESEAQHAHAIELQKNLEQTKRVLAHTMVEHQKELERQADAIKSQQPVIDAIHRSKLRTDLLTDTSIFVLSLYTVNTFLVEYPLHVAGQVLMTKAPKPRRKFARQAAKGLIVLLLMRKLKGLVRGYGLHNK
ncbi:hypothetical protein HDU98_012223 [Podochytrium sp. JEL0797]|nr:hypothetical protein HDU98_012223 [Podochytrium sp. JEL0797]